jgi:hypothetical protein
LRLFLAILFILLGGLLLSITIDDIGIIVRLMLKIIGLGCFFLAYFIGKGKKKHLNQT